MVEDDEDNFNVAPTHNGDQMMLPFQCDVCHFLNIHNRFPTADNHFDELLLMCIRRVILNSMSDRDWSTVHSSLLEVFQYVKIQN